MHALMSDQARLARTYAAIGGLPNARQAWRRARTSFTAMRAARLMPSGRRGALQIEAAPHASARAACAPLDAVDVTVVAVGAGAAIVRMPTISLDVGGDWRSAAFGCVFLGML